MDQTAPVVLPARHIAAKRIVDLDAMPPAERDTLGRQLFQVHRQIFAGLDEAGFIHKVMEQGAERNLLQLYLDDTGAIAGYCALHRHARILHGRACTVIRAEAGLRPEFRGRGTTYWFGMTHALRLKLRHPVKPVYYLGTLVHASSYHLFCKYFLRVYPSPGRPMPAQMRALALELIDSFDSPAVDAADPLVRDVGWITLETPQEAALNERSELPDVQYYLQRNPGYRLGHGLVTLVPLSLGSILGAIAVRLWECLRVWLRRRPPKL